MPRKKSSQEPQYDELPELQSTSENKKDKNTEPVSSTEAETAAEAEQTSSGLSNNEALENAFTEQFSISEDAETDVTALADASEVVPQERSESFDDSDKDRLEKSAYRDTEVPVGLLASDTDTPTVNFTEEEQWAVSAPGDLAESLDPPPADFMLLNEELAADRQDCLFSEQTATADAGVEQVSEFGHLRDAPIDAEKMDPDSRRPNAREEFFALNVKKLDRRLSAKQQEEWENIYASFRAHSALHGIISGKETISLKVFNAETGANEIKEILCLTVVQYRVKVLIPETELWADGQAHPRHIVSHMIGAQINCYFEEKFKWVHRLCDHQC